MRRSRPVKSVVVLLPTSRVSSREDRVCDTLLLRIVRAVDWWQYMLCCEYRPDSGRISQWVQLNVLIPHRSLVTSSIGRPRGPPGSMIISLQHTDYPGNCYFISMSP